MMTAREFITSAFDDFCLYDDPHHITPDEAAYTMAAWKEEGLCYPPSVTPLLFARFWNILCDKHNNK